MNQQLSFDLMFTILHVVSAKTAGKPKTDKLDQFSYHYRNHDFESQSKLKMQSLIIRKPPNYYRVSEGDFYTGDYYKVDKRIDSVEYAPDVFAHLRELDNISTNELKNKLGPDVAENIARIKKAGEGMGKSGSFFFSCYDDSLLIKTMPEDDFTAFMKLLPHYFEHVNTYRKSLLARIYGIYQVKLEGMNPVFLILMGSVKQIGDQYVKRVYDLKGSTVKREVFHVNDEGKKEADGEDYFKATDILKDLNLKKLMEKEIILKFDKADQNAILAEMFRSVTLLNMHNLMDYSLLFCVSYNPKYVSLHPEKFHRVNGRYVLKTEHVEHNLKEA
mmetsp:Transcript_991/g.1185  ORF Transcript_991/g.1185 Transcript_991/m.1185 type:complete len:331 (+) Transcript_991:750-1742(+)|eukprot:CAMPEP_0170502412 /NCGR_PEP_ID=MMETSP0208-20121228/41413_1 /TAXON_ID=197538 /ORGANISM="Strombidium inclinatum, Strain S3" /LENGTH=330 /DNA_ID=CAMNT_0010781475 /DNA_START=726 /DNA_END=1718 /DNA_ORIENTATION=+